MLIPFFFILLRIWSCIIDILMYAEIDIHKLSWVVALVLILLSVSHQFLHPLTTHCLFIHHVSLIKHLSIHQYHIIIIHPSIYLMNIHLFIHAPLSMLVLSLGYW